MWCDYDVASAWKMTHDFVLYKNNIKCWMFRIGNWCAPHRTMEEVESLGFGMRLFILVFTLFVCVCEKAGCKWVNLCICIVYISWFRLRPSIHHIVELYFQCYVAIIYPHIHTHTICKTVGIRMRVVLVSLARITSMFFIYYYCYCSVGIFLAILWASDEKSHILSLSSMIFGFHSKCVRVWMRGTMCFVTFWRCDVFYHASNGT